MELLRILGRLAFYWACFLFCLGCWWAVIVGVRYLIGLV